jgi:hypothetical protein
VPEIVVDGNVVLYPGTTAQLRATPQDLTFAWSSSEGADGGFADVDQTGNVTGYLPGTAPVTVTATVMVNGESVQISKTVDLTVREPVLQIIEPTEIVYEGHDYEVRAQVENGTGQTKNFTNWRVLGSNAATIAEGAPDGGDGDLPADGAGGQGQFPGPYDPLTGGFDPLNPPRAATLTTLRPAEVRIAVDYVVQHPTDRARDYSKTVQTQNLVQIRPIKSEVSGTTYVNMAPGTGDPNAPPVAAEPTLTLTVAPGHVHGAIIAWYINDKRYTADSDMTGVPISYPQEQTVPAGPDWGMPPPPGMSGFPPPPASSPQPVDMPTRTVFFTFRGQECAFVCVRPVFCCGTVTRAAENTLEITVADSRAAAAAASPGVSPSGGGTGSVTTPPPPPAPPTVTIQVTSVQSATPDDTPTTPAPTETQFVVAEGTALTVQAAIGTSSTSSAQTSGMQSPASPAYAYTWCYSPPNPLVETPPATSTGTSTSSTAPSDPDPLQLLSGQGTNTAQFKLNKPGRYTLQCRIFSLDKCLGLSAMSQLVSVRVYSIDHDTDAPTRNATDHTGGSPLMFDRDQDTLDPSTRMTTGHFVADTGGDLDSYLFRADRPNGRLTFTVNVTRYFGQVDATGHLVEVATLIQNRVIDQNATLKLAVYDLDINGNGFTGSVNGFSGTSEEKAQLVSVNGQPLNGDTTAGVFTTPAPEPNNQWRVIEFTVPVGQIIFPARGIGGQAPGNAANTFLIVLDQSKARRWALEIDWAQLDIKGMTPIVLVHGNSGNKHHWEGRPDDQHKEPQDLDPPDRWQPFYLALDEKKVLYDRTISLAVPTGRASRQANAQELGKELQARVQQFGTRHISLICHSKGGLDSRAWLVLPTRLNQPRNQQIAVVNFVTLATPHYGSVLADVVRDAKSMFRTVDKMKKPFPPPFQAITASSYVVTELTTQLGHPAAGAFFGGTDDPANLDLTVERCGAFSETNVPQLSRYRNFDGTAPRFYSVSVDADRDSDARIDYDEVRDLMPFSGALVENVVGAFQRLPLGGTAEDLLGGIAEDVFVAGGPGLLHHVLMVHRQTECVTSADGFPLLVTYRNATGGQRNDTLVAETSARGPSLFQNVITPDSNQPKGLGKKTHVTVMSREIGLQVLSACFGVP